MKFAKYNTLITSILIISSCSQKTETESSKSVIEAGSLVPVVTASVEQETETFIIPESLALRGYIHMPPEDKASIHPMFEGFVKDVNIHPGDVVKKGDVLFSLQNPSYLELQQNYLETKEKLAYLKDEYDRKQALKQENIASSKDLKKAETYYNMSKAMLASLEGQIKMMGISLDNLENGKFTDTIQIRSTINGSVTLVDINKGAFVESTHEAVAVINIANTHLELEVFEKDAAKVKKGQKLSFKLPEVNNQEFEAVITHVGKEIDANKRTIVVIADLLNRSDDILPGMYVEAEIIL